MNSPYESLFKKALSKAQMKAAFEAYRDLPVYARNKRLAEIIEPAMPKINELTGQQNITSFMAYALEFVFNEKGGEL